MTTYCQKCHGILNKHAPPRCPECGEPTQDHGPVPAEPRYLDSECGGGGCRLTPATDAEIKHAAQFSPGSVTPAAEVVTKPESFTPAQMVVAIGQWLAFGEDQLGSAHCGYYSGSGWAARALDAARDFIQKAGAE